MKTGREICHLFIYLFSKRSLFKMFRTDEPYGHKWLYSFKVINERYIAWQEYLLLLPKTTMKISALDM